MNFGGKGGVAFNNQIAHVRSVQRVHLHGRDEAGSIAGALRWVLENRDRLNITAVNLASLDDEPHTQRTRSQVRRPRRPTSPTMRMCLCVCVSVCVCVCVSVCVCICTCVCAHVAVSASRLAVWLSTSCVGRAQIDEPLQQLRRLGVWVSAPSGNNGFAPGVSWPANAEHCFAIGGVAPAERVAERVVINDRDAVLTDIVVAATATSSSNACVVPPHAWRPITPKTAFSGGFDFFTPSQPPARDDSSDVRVEAWR